MEETVQTLYWLQFLPEITEKGKQKQPTVIKFKPQVSLKVDDHNLGGESTME